MKMRCIKYLMTFFLLPIISFGGTVIFDDTFMRPDSIYLNNDLPAGQNGQMDLKWKNTGASTGSIQNNSLLITPAGSHQVFAIDRNFTDSFISQAGGFRVTADLIALRSIAGSDGYYGIAIGVAEDKINEEKSGDFWVGFTAKPSIQIYSSGRLLEDISVDKMDGILELTCTLTSKSFLVGDYASVSARINGTIINLNSKSASTDRPFMWKQTNANYIKFECSKNVTATLGSLKVELLDYTPIPSHLARKTPVTTPTPTQIALPPTPTKNTAQTSPTKNSSHIFIAPTKKLTPEELAAKKKEEQKVKIDINPIIFIGLLPPFIVLLLKRGAEDYY